MKTVRFLRDTDARREGGLGYKAGATVTLSDDSAKRWIARSAAEAVEALKEPPAPPAPPAPDQLDLLLGTANVNTVESTADVAGPDGRDHGDGSEHDEGASQPRARGRGSRSRSQ